MLRDLFHPRTPTSRQLRVGPDPELPRTRTETGKITSYPDEFATYLVMEMGKIATKECECLHCSAQIWSDIKTSIWLEKKKTKNKKQKENSSGVYSPNKEVKNKRLIRSNNEAPSFPPSFLKQAMSCSLWPCGQSRGQLALCAAQNSVWVPFVCLCGGSYRSGAAPRGAMFLQQRHATEGAGADATLVLLHLGVGLQVSSQVGAVGKGPVAVGA